MPLVSKVRISWKTTFVFLQDEIDVEVKRLLALKAEYKSATGKDWKPGAHVAMGTPGGGNVKEVKQENNQSQLIDDLNNKITAQGNKVRDLKTNKAPKVRNTLWTFDRNS